MKFRRDISRFLIAFGFLAFVFLYLSFSVGEARKENSRSVNVSLSNPRIISLVPSVTENLFLLGMADHIVGVTVYCKRPPPAGEKQKVGTVIDINIEKIIGLNPTLVIASTLADKKQIKKLRNLGIDVRMFTEAKDFVGICENLFRLSRMVGREDKARHIVEKAKNELKAIREGIKGAQRSRVFIQIGANPLFTANREYSLNDAIEHAGAINIASDATTGIYSREEVIKRNPDIILIVTMGIVGEKEKEIWLRYDSVNAAKDRRIFSLDSYRVCSPTPISFVETVKELARMFYVQQ